MKALSDGEVAVQRAAMDALSACGEDAAPPVANLTALLSNPKVNRSAARCQGKIGPPAREAVPDLIRLATAEYDDDETRMAVTSAVVALGDIGPGASSAVPALLEVHRDGNTYRRRDCSAAIWSIDPAAAKKAGIDEPAKH